MASQGRKMPGPEPTPVVECGTKASFNHPQTISARCTG
jgi:hypothetical protein